MSTADVFVSHVGVRDTFFRVFRSNADQMRTLWETIKFFDSRESLFARKKFKGIDGSDTTTEWVVRFNLTQHAEFYQCRTL